MPNFLTCRSCGPHKLARVLEHCIDRFESPSENIAPIRIVDSSTSVYPPSQSQSDPLGTSIPVRELSTPLVNTANGASTTLTKVNAATSPLNILIVDDNAINRRLLVALMKKHKFQFREAVNGLEALKLYQATSPPFDAVLMGMFSLSCVIASTILLYLHVHLPPHVPRPT
jgi:hypothetical protein